MNRCPCQPLIDTNEPFVDYANCCQSFHTGKQVPQTAEQLMRSRYSAYVLADEASVDYIIATTLPAQQAFMDKDGIRDWAKQTKWAGLEVIQHIAKVGKRHAQVEFKAWFTIENNKNAHHELSTFVKITSKHKKQWYFIDPTVKMKMTQKQPCLCGSGEKFKRCCGMFLG